MGAPQGWHRAHHHRIQRNATESPLLRLPGELRDRIFRLVIGDQVIHLLRIDKHVPFGQKNRPKCYTHGVCIAERSEDNAYQDFMEHGYQNRPPPFPFEPGYNGGHLPYFRCHDRCVSMCKNQGNAGQHGGSRISLGLLLTCQQAYVESFHLLWATNTFSFEDPETLQFFTKALNPLQKAKLNAMHIHKRCDEDQYYVQNKWRHVRTATFLRNVKSLRTLHVTFYSKNLSSTSDHDTPWSRIANLSTEPLGAMKSLDLKHVTAAIVNEYYTQESYRPIIATRNRETVEKFRQKLLDPQGSAVYAREVAIEKSNKAVKREMYLIGLRKNMACENHDLEGLNAAREELHKKEKEIRIVEWGNWPCFLSLPCVWHISRWAHAANFQTRLSNSGSSTRSAQTVIVTIFTLSQSILYQKNYQHGVFHHLSLFIPGQ